MQRRLYLRIYFAFLGVLVAMGLVSVGINLAAGRLSFWTRGGPRFANHLARLLPPVDDAPAMQRAVDELHDELGVDITVLDRAGQPLATAGTAIPPPDPHEAPHARGPAWVRGLHGVIAGPLRGGGVVLARLPVPEGRNWHLRPLLPLVAALLVSLALVYPLSRSITRPIEQLTSAVEAYGKGDLGKRSGLVASQDEVGRLARAFDEMADRIQATRKAEKELLANVSHELRTPLARIRVAMALIDASDPLVRQRLAAVDEELDELERLVADVLTSSKLELSAQPLRKARVRIGELVEKSRARALLLGHQVVAEVEPGLEVDADEALLVRALDNLLDNARKYGGAEPTGVEARRADGSVLIAVRDRGPGFSADELERVFDPFYRGTSARGQASGFGLGLSLARRVAGAHNGSIRAANAPGGGALIELRIPA